MKQNIFILIFSLWTFAAGATENDELVQENFNEVLKGIADTHWTGVFQVRGPALGQRCRGPLDVKFFPLTVEDFSNGTETVSYRHHADFSKNLNPLCKYIAGRLSPVAVGNCGSHFPTKYSSEENKNVPFRTIIPSTDGKSANISSPACNNTNLTIERSFVKMNKARLYGADRFLDIELEIQVSGLKYTLTYELFKNSNL